MTPDPDPAAMPPHTLTLLTQTDVARMFGVQPRTIRNWVRKGLLPQIRVAGVVRYRLKDLETLLGE